MPSPPLRPPGALYASTVSFAGLFGGALDTFDASNATSHLAAGLNINRDQVTLKVTAGSVRVEGTISFINAPESADSVQSQLSDVMSNSSRVFAIFGLPLEGIDRMPVVIHKLLLLTALPPPPSPSTSNVAPVSASPDVDLGIPLPLFAALLGAGGTLLCGTFACGILVCFIHHHRGRHQQKERPDARAMFGRPTHAAEGSIRPGLSKAPEWPELVPTDATSAELVFSTGKFPDRKTSVYSSAEASSTSAYKFSQLDTAERRRRRKASLCAGDECYSGATGTKDAPENPSGFRRTQTHDHPTTTVPPPSSVTTASSPLPRHDHFATTLPPPCPHRLAASTLLLPSRRHTLAATTLPPPRPQSLRRQSLGSTEPPARESGDASRYLTADSRRNSNRVSVYV